MSNDHSGGEHFQPELLSNQALSEDSALHFGHRAAWLTDYSDLTGAYDGEDALQDAYLSSLQRVGEVEMHSPGAVSSYVMKAAINKSRDHKRRLRRAGKTISTDELEAVGFEVPSEAGEMPGESLLHDPAIESEAAERIIRQLTTPSEPSKRNSLAKRAQVLHEVAFNGSTQEQIASTLDLALGTVQSNFFRARQRAAELAHSGELEVSEEYEGIVARYVRKHA